MRTASELWFRQACRYWIADLEPSDLSADQEERLVCQFLSELGADPERLGRIGDLLALALASTAWQNAWVEGWRTAGQLNDGELLRVNSYTTWAVRRRVRGWLAENQLRLGGPAAALDQLKPDAVCQFSALLAAWLVNRRRRLPIGMTLGALAGRDLPGFATQAERPLEALATLAQQRGAKFAVLRAAAHGSLTCRRWWPHPNWPVTVDNFIRTIDIPGDMDRANFGGEVVGLPADPPDLCDRAQLRKTLLTAPWRLSPEAATRVAAVGMGHRHY